METMVWPPDRLAEKESLAMEEEYGLLDVSRLEQAKEFAARVLADLKIASEAVRSAVGADTLDRLVDDVAQLKFERGPFETVWSRPGIRGVLVELAEALKRALPAAVDPGPYADDIKLLHAERDYLLMADKGHERLRRIGPTP
jgi:hypothetical protein